MPWLTEPWMKGWSLISAALPRLSQVSNHLLPQHVGALQAACWVSHWAAAFQTHSLLSRAASYLLCWQFISRFAALTALIFIFLKGQLRLTSVACSQGCLLLHSTGIPQRDLRSHQHTGCTGSTPLLPCWGPTNTYPHLSPSLWQAWKVG